MADLLSLAGYAGLTIAVELPLLWALGYREKRFFAVAALINAITNLSLNLVLGLVNPTNWWLAVGIGEVLVVITEWLVLGIVIREPSRFPFSQPTSIWRLGGSVLLANLVTTSIGILM